MRNYPYVIILAILSILTGCASLPTDFERPESYALRDTDTTALGRKLSQRIEAHPGQSGFYLLSDGLDAFAARAVLAGLAERSIDVQYYLYHDDLVGRLFTDQLLKAADRGVRVRLLVDDMDLTGRDAGAAALDSHPNIEVRIFNPFSRQAGRASQLVTRMGEVTRRMHNKSFTVDNQASILGGRNIGNEYFAADPDLAFADLDVMAIGPVAQTVSSAFDQYWNSDVVYPAAVLMKQPLAATQVDQLRRQLHEFVARQADSVYLENLRDSDLVQKIKNNKITFAWGNAHLVYDQPDKIRQDLTQTEYHLAPQLKPYFEQVGSELIIFSPYFVPGKSGTAFLTQLAARGVSVRILTNSLASNDVGIVHSGYARYRKALLRGGVQLYEMNKKLTRAQRRDDDGIGGSSKASLHAKSFVFDRRQVFIGSLNLDPRSVVHNTEIGLVIRSSEIGSDMATAFDENIAATAFRLELVKDTDGSEKILWHAWSDGDPVTFDVDPYTSFWQRLGVGLMSILPIESQL